MASIQKWRVPFLLAAVIGVPSGVFAVADLDNLGVINANSPDKQTLFDTHPIGNQGRQDVGLDHAYALTSYAVQGSTRDVSTSRVDATTTRAETARTSAHLASALDDGYQMVRR